MNIEKLSRGEAQEAMQDWLENYPQLPKVDKEYEQIRNDLHEINKRVREAANLKHISKGVDYFIDSNIAIELYKYFAAKSWFTPRVAENDGFWRYLSIKVVPDMIAQRWGKDNAEHYYARPTRIWLRSLWWFIYHSWQGNIESTEKIVFSDHFTTDMLLNFEERSGRKGVCVAAYRKIIFYYSKLNSDIVSQYKKKHKNGDDLFRVVMKLNTARMLVMEPELCEGGADGYAKKLFIDAGVDVDAT